MPHQHGRELAALF